MACSLHYKHCSEVWDWKQNDPMDRTTSKTRMAKVRDGSCNRLSQFPTFVFLTCLRLARQPAQDSAFRP